MDGNAEISWHQLRMRMAVNASFAHGFRILRYTATLIYGKNPSKILFSGTGPDFYKTWYVALGTPAHHTCSNDNPGVTLTY